jgi:hypothetical protein
METSKTKEIGKFLTWWWEGLGSSNRKFISALTYVLSLLPGIFFFGPMYFAFFFGSFALFLLFLLGREVWRGVNKSWARFQEEQESERQRVANKLRGSVPDIYANPEDRVSEILRRLKSSSKTYGT